MNKQIDEMACAMCGQDKICGGVGVEKCIIYPDYRRQANRLYTADYRKQVVGEWKWIADDDCICSACGKVFYTADNADAGTTLWNFCPNCGAKMKGDKTDV